jgi:hypothetical protein
MKLIKLRINQMPDMAHAYIVSALIEKDGKNYDWPSEPLIIDEYCWDKVMPSVLRQLADFLTSNKEITGA